MRVFADRALWHYVFNIHTIGEFDQIHFYVAGFCRITRSRHHAFQSNRIGSDQRRITTVGELCLNDNFFTCLVDLGHEPKLIDALAVEARRPVVNLMMRNWRTKNRRQTLTSQSSR
jgi:hypothetical protein